MIYQPKMLYNPTNETIEFMCGGQIYIFKPGEKRIVEGFPAHHALKEVNTGLIEWEGQESKPADMPLEDMPWRGLVSLASSLGVYKPGMSKESVIGAIKEIDGQEEGTL